ncbi:MULTISPECIES: MAE_28990/MAE_18760 family HEPN-like nuclease [Pseudomonadaceae]|uniref:MAE_28990/MAE_18760 family HEPN-like nuclease n=1 Tax=Pseudomonadaceae TaxID=135621 RepID=UPI000AD5A1D5|nr:MULTISPECIES: MAE_28990/MAE_18760 family HEPN-like nuclease [Pseudomonas]
MLRSLDDFNSSVEKLLAHLAYEKESQLFFRDGLRLCKGGSELEVEFRKFVEGVVGGSALRTKIFSYQNAIISIYGYLERFVEEVIVEYLKRVSEVCPEYGKLPVAVRKNHLGLSMDLINKIQKNKGWSEADRKARLSDAVSNMNHFLSEQGELKVNHDAFTSHTSNFRYDTIHEVFSRIGIDAISRQCLSNRILLAALCGRHGLEEDASHKVLVSLLTAELDDLAQRRNEIAHGVRIDEIESSELTNFRVRLIAAYVWAVAEVVEGHLWQYIFEVSSKIPLGKPDCIFPKIKVIGFEGVALQADYSGSRRVSVGDMLFAVNEKSSEQCLYGRIISLQYDGAAQEFIELPCDGDVSMKVELELSENFKKRSLFVVVRA